MLLTKKKSQDKKNSANNLGQKAALLKTPEKQKFIQATFTFQMNQDYLKSHDVYV